MILYYARLAIRSIVQSPGLSFLIVLTIAVGIGVSMTNYSLYYLMSSNPMQHKNNQIYAVQLDGWDATETYDSVNSMPLQLTYKDAMALLDAEVGVHRRAAAMFRSRMTVVKPESDIRSATVQVRIANAAFFPMFDVPFKYGSVWTEEQEHDAASVTVISHEMNNRYFNGENSVGKTITLNDNLYTIVGVLDEWNLSIKVYDPTNNAFDDPEEFYIPMSLVPVIEPFSIGSTYAWKEEDVDSYSSVLASEMTWLQFWVELDGVKHKQAYSDFIEGYILEQKRQGRFERPLGFNLATPEEWLQINEVVNEDNRVLVWLSLAFLLVCIINSAALLVAKFTRKAPEAGVRRALGASQRSIFSQHLIESAVMGAGGAVLGLMITQLGLMFVRALFLGRMDKLTYMDTTLVLISVSLAILATLLAGIYPAWRVALAAPARYLKTQ